jgi:sec-independent protein translocase protein TatC
MLLLVYQILISTHPSSMVICQSKLSNAFFIIFDILQVSGYCGLLIGSPIILYEIIAFVLPGLTKDERKFLGPIVLGSSVLFYLGILFSYTVLAPAALNFFVNYAEGAVESIWSIDQYFEFVLVLLFSTGLSFQVNMASMLRT